MGEEKRTEQQVRPATSQTQALSTGGIVEELFRLHHQRILRVAYRITGSVSDAEDVLQTIFLRLARRQRVPNLEEQAGAYLHRAALNAALDIVRRRNASPNVPLAVVASTLEAKAPSPHQERQRAELRARLRVAIARLNPRAAEVFCLRHLEGCTNQEIAQLLRTSDGTVAVTLHRARARLRQELCEEETR